ncbi:ATP-binding cassette domain-containing protein (plasmid) [Deinococcus sp. KNUC1210]|uniref:ABC transporter ATP-binding protein/permease n=1 Tax=Deinococcus sp. KNUC1210 TaxID=2917691 RepID=UPI001EF05968|nr:ATP-binding cassette domain-containing protein [Deinococcus sp. KNUC1210]ULH17289.1 ATP-binding cassette domain-containing protein [Deinococcus sp. KNUC1210]
MPNTERPPNVTRRLNLESGVRPLVVGSALLSFVGALLGVGAWLLLARGITGLAFGPQASSWVLPCALLLLLVRALLNAARETWNARSSARIVGGLRERAAARLIALGPGVLADLGESRSAVGLLESLPKLSAYYARWLPQAAHSAAGLLVAGSALCWLDWQSALIVAITVPLCVLFLVLVGWAAQDASQNAWTATTRLGARLSGSLSALPTLRAFGADAAQAQALAGEAQTYRAATLGVLKMAFLSGFVLDFAATMSAALIAVTVGVRLFEARLDFASALATLLLLPELFGPLRQLGTDRHASMDAQAPARSLYALLDTPGVPSGTRRVDGVPSLSLNAAGLTLAGREVLRAVNLRVAAGEQVALRGESGSGKTSLLRGLRKDVPLSGDVRINGIPLDELETRAWRENIAVVTQRPRFLPGTLRANLAVPEAELERVLTAVGLTAFPDTVLSEDGSPLSGGERARLALARAALSNAPLLLLDEPTAHLDPLAEREVLSLLGTLFAGRTLLLVTHRHVPAGCSVARLVDGTLIPDVPCSEELRAERTVPA